MSWQKSNNLTTYNLIKTTFVTELLEVGFSVWIDIKWKLYLQFEVDNSTSIYQESAKKKIKTSKFTFQKRWFLLSLYTNKWENQIIQPHKTVTEQ